MSLESLLCKDITELSNEDEYVKEKGGTTLDKYEKNKQNNRPKLEIDRMWIFSSSKFTIIVKLKTIFYVSEKTGTFIRDDCSSYVTFIYMYNNNKLLLIHVELRSTALHILPIHMYRYRLKIFFFIDVFPSLID